MGAWSAGLIEDPDKLASALAEAVRAAGLWAILRLLMWSPRCAKERCDEYENRFWCRFVFLGFFGSLAAAGQAVAPLSERGKQTFMRVGCYMCRRHHRTE